MCTRQGLLSLPTAAKHQGNIYLNGDNESLLTNCVPQPPLGEKKTYRESWFTFHSNVQPLVLIKDRRPRMSTLGTHTDVPAALTR